MPGSLRSSDPDSVPRAARGKIDQKRRLLIRFAPFAIFLLFLSLYTSTLVTDATLQNGDISARELLLRAATAKIFFECFFLF